MEESKFNPDNNIIIIYYINISGMSPSSAKELLHNMEIRNRETSPKIKQIFISVTTESRVECIQLTSNKI